MPRPIELQKYDWCLTEIENAFGNTNVSIKKADTGREIRIVVNNGLKRTSLVIQWVPRGKNHDGSEKEFPRADLEYDSNTLVMVKNWIAEVKKMWRLP